MDKCCNNCSGQIEAGACDYIDMKMEHFRYWDLSKDYCSKYSKKEKEDNSLWEEIAFILREDYPDDENEILTNMIKKRIKQRIEESLEKARDPNRAREGKDKVDYEYRQAFDWIL